ncbi:ATP-binding protein, partial [Burkholderia sp. Ac-20379]|uniref:ATP-binding protein n=1 Tax=Burkholderia sp. Ac-20379 TaxID=2703900 RepID=UPI001DDCC9F5|nr:sensor histidine kinase [Burkholderia sp. Ac-20379]
NVARPARPRSADVRLDATATHLELSIADDGAGFGTHDADREHDHARTGRGLLHMQARCAAFGGALSIDARPDGGTLLRARFAWHALAGRPAAAAQASAS